MPEKKIIVTNNSSELNKIRDILETIRQEWNVDDTTIFNLDLSIDEIFSNIINYAWGDDEIHQIEFVFHKINNQISLTITDDGLAFNPLKHKVDNNENKTLDNAKIGGLGIHFVKKLMSKIEYERKNNKNILILKS